MNKEYSEQPLQGFVVWIGRFWWAVCTMWIVKQTLKEKGSVEQINGGFSYVNANSYFISLVMAVWNKRHYLPVSINSTLAQDWHFFELLCIDDGSVDKSAEIILDYMKMVKNIRLVRFIANKGTHFARVAAVFNAFGSFLFSVDPDDALKPNCLSTCYRVAVEHHADAVQFRTLVRLNGRFVKHEQTDIPRLPNTIVTRMEAKRLFWRGAFPLACWMRCIRTKVYAESLSVLEPEDLAARIYVGEDWFHTGLIIMRASKWLGINDYLYAYHWDLNDSATHFHTPRERPINLENLARRYLSLGLVPGWIGA